MTVTREGLCPDVHLGDAADQVSSTEIGKDWDRWIGAQQASELVSLNSLPVCAGREREDNLECWVAVTTEAYAQDLISEMPLFKEGGQYVPQTKEALTDIATRIWDAVKGVLKPFTGGAYQLGHLLSPSELRCRRSEGAVST